MGDPTKEPQEPKKDELSAEQLDAVAGGGAISDAIQFARDVGAKVSGGGSGSEGGLNENQIEWLKGMGVDVPK